jgi:hypothetical protein
MCLNLTLSVVITFVNSLACLVCGCLAVSFRVSCGVFLTSLEGGGLGQFWFILNEFESHGERL